MSATTIRALVVDDEEPARSKVRALVEASPGFAVVGEAANGRDAVEAIRGLAPDVCFLDVRMPRLDGFGVVRAVGVEAMPLVVFVTAHDEHALEAFEVHALDYLLKPFTAERFARTLDRVRERAGREGLDQAGRLGSLLAERDGEPRWIERVLARHSPNREVLLAVDEVDVFRARRNEVELVTAEHVHTCRATLKSFEERLDPARFLRLNRSEIVRLDAVREFQPWFHGDYRACLRSGEQLVWSRRYRAQRKGEFEVG